MRFFDTDGMFDDLAETRRPFTTLMPAELRTVQAYLAYRVADAQRAAEAFEAAGKAIFSGYPKGATIGDIVSGKAHKLTVVQGSDGGEPQ